MEYSQDCKIKKRSVRISGHPTSVSIENVFWVHLKKLSKDQNRSVNSIISEIDVIRAGNLSSAIRVYIFNQLLNNNCG